MSRARRPATPARPKRKREPPGPPSYWKVAAQYADDVLAGVIPSGPWVRAACARFLADLEREDIEPTEEGERWCRWLEMLPHVKGKWAQTKQRLKLSPWQVFCTVNLYGWRVVATGRRRFREGYVEVPRKNGKTFWIAGLALGHLCIDGEFGAEVYCLDASTKLLCDDLVWRPIGELSTGAGLIAFDENPPPRPQTYRKFRRASVLSTRTILRPSWRVTFSDGGSVIASGEHTWLCKRAPVGQRQDWCRTDALYPGSRIRYLGCPWETDYSHGAGYLSGIYDGEGCIASGLLNSPRRAGFRVSVAQKPGAVLERTKQLLTERGFTFVERGHASGVHKLDMQRAYECLRFLGSIRPNRLLEKAEQLYEGRALNRGSCWRVVSKVEPLGDREVVAIRTTTGTFFADGMYSHNCGATTEKQAWEVFRPAKQICEREPALRERFGLEVNAKVLNILANGSRFEPVIGDPGDGASPSAGIADEFHEHKTSDLVDTFVTGMGAREQPMMLYITTAGVDMGGPCYAKRADVIDILKGTVEDDSIFGVIYGLDEDDPWDTVEAQRKANPNFGISVDEVFLAGQLAQAKRSATKQTAYRTKHLNQWVGAKAAWMNMLAYQACRKKALTLDGFAGARCFAAVDLASKVDIASMALLFERDGRYAAFCRHYLPEDTIAEGGNTRYKAWHAEGWITATPGNVIDYQFIEDDLDDFKSRFELVDLAYDPFQATQFATRAQERGFPVTEFGQTVKNFSEPMKELEAWILKKRISFEFDPVLTWMFGNVVAKVDAKDNIFPRKERPEAKIDGVVALIMCVGRLLFMRQETNPYDSGDLFSVEL